MAGIMRKKLIIRDYSLTSHISGIRYHNEITVKLRTYLTTSDKTQIIADNGNSHGDLYEKALTSLVTSL